MNKEILKKCLNWGVILISLAAVLYIVFSNGEVTDLWSLLGSLDGRWMALGLLCPIGYVTFEGIGLWRLLKRDGCRLSPFTAIHLSLVGLFYANITPGASGGQPMEIFRMSQQGIPVEKGTSAMTVRLFTNQSAILLLGLGLTALHRGFVHEQLHALVVPIVLGCIINAAVLPLVLLATYRIRWISAFAAGIIGFAARHGWIKKPEELLSRVETLLNGYHCSMINVLSRPGTLAVQLLLSVLSMGSLMLASGLVYRALGQSGTTPWQLMTVACLLFLSSSYTPLPGASGASEGGFLLYYRGLFHEGTLSPALLLWRFLTYYIFLFIGMADTLAGGLRHPKKQREKPMQQ